MRNIFWFVLAAIVFAAVVCPPSRAQEISVQYTATLYSPLQYNNDSSRATIDLQRGGYARWSAQGDLFYGYLRAGDEFDWLQSSTRQESRTVIRDLGKHEWTDQIAVPWVEPLPKLKPGEQRAVLVDASGADGGDGLPGVPGKNGEPGVDGRNATRGTISNTPDLPVLPETPAVQHKPKHDGKIKTSPEFVRAIAGHIYVIHVVDNQRDFYALIRIESLQRGDNCTISWKLIPAPPSPAADE